MSSINIDETLNDHLGLPVDYQLDKLEAFKLYRYFLSLFPSEKASPKWRLFFYVDKHGDFIDRPKNKQDSVVKAIFDNMEKGDQFSVLQYIAEHLEK